MWIKSTGVDYMGISDIVDDVGLAVLMSIERIFVLF
jgi:hypothetical protein